MPSKHHLYIGAAIGGLAIGFFILSGGNCYGAGKWGQSTFGAAYNAGAKL